MSSSPQTVPQLLDACLRRDPSRPLVTFYDRATGERVELSVATTQNWVSKTANMLQDSLGVEHGATVAVDLPPHWERVVWLLAVWAVGARVAPAPAGSVEGDVAVAVVGPDDPTPRDADETVALSLRPLGGRFGTDLPAGVVDYNAEVLGHGDVFSAYVVPTGADDAVLLPDGTVRSQRECLEAARRLADGWGVDEPRVLTDDSGTPEDVVTTLLAAMSAHGSLVVVAAATDADLTLDGSLAAAERATVVVRG